MVIFKILRFLIITGAILIGIKLAGDIFLLQIICGTLTGTMARRVCDIIDAYCEFLNSNEIEEENN